MASLVQRSFAGGEIAPAVYGRADQVKYQTGLRICRNFIVRRHGGVSNRAGTQYIATVKDSSLAHRLLKFIFNAEQTYILLFGNQNMRVVRNGAQLTVSGVTAWSAVTAYVVGDLASRLGVNYYCIAAHTNQQPPNATYWYAMPADGTYEIPTPYVTADLSTLQYTQSGDVLTITHPNYGPRDLSRLGHTTWKLTLNVFAPGQAAPTGVGIAGTAGALTFTYHVTAIASESFEESLAATGTQGALTAPSAAQPHTITWVAASGASEYAVYLVENGVPSFIGSAIGTTFVNDGITPDNGLTPPQTRTPFVSAGNYPSTSGYVQQRRLYANSDNEPEKVWGSKSGSFHNFSISSPLQDDDALTFTVAGRQVNEIRHLVDLGKLIILTSGGEWVAEGDGVTILPDTPGLRQHSYNGSSERPPVIIGSNLLYVQARGSSVRDLRYEFATNGYNGNDLTVFAAHLFDGFTIVQWDYAQIPHSIVWAVRSDGVLLGLTYLREHEIWAWHRHDTFGYFEDVAVVPEGNEDAVYVLVQRTINGATVRYLERFASRHDDQSAGDVADEARFMDAHLSYDGRNTGATTMTLSGGSTWAYDETLTLTASAPFFVAGDVDNVIELRHETTTWSAEAGFTTTIEKIRITIHTFSSTTVVLGRANKTVPTTLRNVAKTTWSKAVDDISGLAHLEGQAVSILADGHVVTNGIDAPLTTVSGGAVHLTRPASLIHIGLPYVADLETLDLELLTSGDTLADKQKIVKLVTAEVESTRGGFWGQSKTDKLYELKMQANESPDEPIEPVTDKIEIPIASNYNLHGRIFVRQRDPLPITILSLIPSLEVGG